MELVFGQPRQRGRREGLAEHGEPGPAVFQVALFQTTPGGDKIVPRLLLGPLPHSLRTVGIVQTEDRRLDPGVGRPGRSRVQLVALDLGRPALVTLDHQPEGTVAQRHRRRVVLRDAG